MVRKDIDVDKSNDFIVNSYTKHLKRLGYILKYS